MIAPATATPAEFVGTLYRYWRESTKPQRPWIVIGAISGRLLTWSVSKRGAKRAAAKVAEPCIVARAEQLEVRDASVPA